MLRASGAFARGRVLSVQPSSLGVGESMMSEVFRLSLEYQQPTPPRAPTSLVVKLPCLEPFRRQIADRFGFYARELAFYSELAEQTPVRVPSCYAQAYNAATGEFMLVFEDVGAKRAVAQIDGCGWHDALAVVESLGALHASWWGRADELPDAVVSIDSPAHIADLVTTFVTSWPTCRGRAGERLPPELVAIGDRWEQIGPRLARRIATPGDAVRHLRRPASPRPADDGRDARPFRRRHHRARRLRRAGCRGLNDTRQLRRGWASADPKGRRRARRRSRSGSAGRRSPRGGWASADPKGRRRARRRSRSGSAGRRSPRGGWASADPKGRRRARRRSRSGFAGRRSPRTQARLRASASSFCSSSSPRARLYCE